MPDENDVPAWAMTHIVTPLGKVQKDIATLTRGQEAVTDHCARINGEQGDQWKAIENQGKALGAHASACPVVRLHHRLFLALLTGIGGAGLSACGWLAYLWWTGRV